MLSQTGNNKLTLDYENAIKWNFAWNGDFEIPKDGVLYASVVCCGCSMALSCIDEPGYYLQSSSSSGEGNENTAVFPVKKGQRFKFSLMNSYYNYAGDLYATFYPYK